MVWIPRNPPFDWQTIPWQASWEPPLGESSPTPPPQIPWTPADVTTIGGWDPSNPDNINDIGGLVSESDDIGTNQNLPCVQATGSRQPETDVRTIGGLNALEYLTDFLEVKTFPTPASGNIVVIGVAEIDAVPSSSSALWSLTGATSFQYDAASGTNQFRGVIDIANNTNLVPPEGNRLGPSIYCNVFNFTSNTMQIRHDGSELASGPYTTQLSTGGDLMFMVNKGGGGFIDGAMGERWVFEDTTLALIQKFEGYLAWKWGLQALLPVDHPYKDAPPTQDPGGFDAGFGEGFGV